MFDHCTSVARLYAARVPSYMDADDLAQDARLYLLRRHMTAGDVGVQTVVRRAMLTSLRKARGRRFNRRPVAVEWTDEHHQPTEDDMLDRVYWRELMRRLLGLGGKHAQIVAMALRGDAFAKIGEDLGITESAVSHMLRRIGAMT